MASELLPCPFCGGEAVTCQTVPGGWSAGCWTVGCHALVGDQKTREKAIASWNRRALPDDVREVLDGLRDALGWIPSPPDYNPEWKEMEADVERLAALLARYEHPRGQ